MTPFPLSYSNNSCFAHKPKLASRLSNVYLVSSFRTDRAGIRGSRPFPTKWCRLLPPPAPPALLLRHPFQMESLGHTIIFRFPPCFERAPQLFLNAVAVCASADACRGGSPVSPRVGTPVDIHGKEPCFCRFRVRAMALGLPFRREGVNSSPSVVRTPNVSRAHTSSRPSYLVIVSRGLSAARAFTSSSFSRPCLSARSRVGPPPRRRRRMRPCAIGPRRGGFRGAPAPLSLAWTPVTHDARDRETRT